MNQRYAVIHPCKLGFPEVECSNYSNAKALAVQTLRFNDCRPPFVIIRAVRS